MSTGRYAVPPTLRRGFDQCYRGHAASAHKESHNRDHAVVRYVPSGIVLVSPIAASPDRIAALRGKSVMIHGGGDNYSDQPAPLGGGGARIACGVIE